VRTDAGAHTDAYGNSGSISNELLGIEDASLAGVGVAVVAVLDTPSLEILPGK
jgi:hypothetical protein